VRISHGHRFRRPPALASKTVDRRGRPTALAWLSVPFSRSALAPRHMPLGGRGASLRRGLRRPAPHFLVHPRETHPGWSGAAGAEPQPLNLSTTPPRFSTGPVCKQGRQPLGPAVHSPKRTST